MDLVPLESIFK